MANTIDSVDAAFTAAVEAAKLEALYQFAYGLSHEINNPLANIATRAQTLLVDERDPKRRRTLATINQQAFRAHEMIADLMLFARPPTVKKEQVNVGELVRTVLDELERQAKEQGTVLALDQPAEPVTISADPTHLAVALKAIVQNALEAVQSGGRVTVDMLTVDADATRLDTQYSLLSTPFFSLRVLDTGPGIPPEIRPHIFDPYFSGREAGRGLGLGLSKAWRLVQLHGGTISVESPPTGGAVFTILLPAG